MSKSQPASSEYVDPTAMIIIKEEMKWTFVKYFSFMVLLTDHLI